MNFIAKNKTWLLFAAAALILGFALFWPEPKKPGDMQKYYSLPQTQLEEIEYSGEMHLGEPAAQKNKQSDAGKTLVHYIIYREENPVRPKEPLYRIEIKSLATTEKSASLRVLELAKLKRFYASSLVRSIVQDWAEPDYYYILQHEPERDAEYGLKDCPNKLRIGFKSRSRNFCIGKPTQGDTRRYLIDTEKNKVLITPDYTVRRLLNNIFAQREQSLYPHGDGADLIELKVSPQALKTFPLLRDKTGGNFKLRLLVKDDGKEKLNVWHVDGILAIKPSHAAELASFVNATRVSAPFAVDAAAAPADPLSSPLAEVMQAAGIDPKTEPTLMGHVKIKKTDRQDTVIGAFAFFPPGIKSRPQPPFQFEQQPTRPLDTLVVSGYNAGYISADNHPRLLSVLTKFESDLGDAQKKGAEEKAKKEKEEREKKGSKP